MKYSKTFWGLPVTTIRYDLLGTTCLTQLVQHMVSKVANNVANYGDP